VKERAPRCRTLPSQPRGCATIWPIFFFISRAFSQNVLKFWCSVIWTLVPAARGALLFGVRGLNCIVLYPTLLYCALLYCTVPLPRHCLCSAVGCDGSLLGGHVTGSRGRRCFGAGGQGDVPRPSRCAATARRPSCRAQDSPKRGEGGVTFGSLLIHMVQMQNYRLKWVGSLLVLCMDFLLNRMPFFPLLYRIHLNPCLSAHTFVAGGPWPRHPNCVLTRWHCTRPQFPTEAPFDRDSALFSACVLPFLNDDVIPVPLVRPFSSSPDLSDLLFLSLH
jgi:hypothetical protein